MNQANESIPELELETPRTVQDDAFKTPRSVQDSAFKTPRSKQDSEVKTPQSGSESGTPGTTSTERQPRFASPSFTPRRGVSFHADSPRVTGKRDTLAIRRREKTRTYSTQVQYKTFISVLTIVTRFLAFSPRQNPMSSDE